MYFLSIKNTEAYEFAVTKITEREEAEYRTYELWNLLHGGNFRGLVVVEKDGVEYEVSTSTFMTSKSWDDWFDRIPE